MHNLPLPGVSVRNRCSVSSGMNLVVHPEDIRQCCPRPGKLPTELVPKVGDDRVVRGRSQGGKKS